MLGREGCEGQWPVSSVTGLPTALSRTFPRPGGRSPAFTIGIHEWHFLLLPLSLQNILNPVSGLDSTSRADPPCLCDLCTEWKAPEGLWRAFDRRRPGGEGRGSG